MKKTFKEYLKPADGAYTEGPMSLVMHQGILYKLDVLFQYSKDLPVTMLPVADLRWQVENVKADDARMKKADTKVAILVHPQNGKYIVLDGTHRLLKAIKAGEKSIPAKIVFEDVLAIARMGSGSDVAFASNVTDQNDYLGEAKKQDAGFGFENKRNADKAKKALQTAGIPFTRSFNFGIHYFDFESKVDAKKALKIVKDVIDSRLESEWN